jgi:hypothetical protein
MTRMNNLITLTYVRSLRSACKHFLDLPEIVKADELEEAILKISQISIRALYEAIEQYREFIDLPGISQQFQKHVELNEEHN